MIDAIELELFIEFKNSCKREIRGGVEMYDINGYYKYLTLSELFDYYFNK